MELKEVKIKEDYVKWFSELNKGDDFYVGKKAANLGELHSRKFPVPSGFVVTKKGYDYFLEETKLKEKIQSVLSKIDYSNKKSIEGASEEIKKLIGDASFPDELREEILESYENLGTKYDLDKGSALDILNSSAEPIFVSIRGSTSEDIGQETQINIKGKHGLIRAVKKGFASLFSVDAIIYRNKKNVSYGETQTAVVIQKMIYSDKSGSMSCGEDIFIEAFWGLGGKGITGIISDEYLVSKDFKIMKKDINEKENALGRNSSGETRIIKLKEGGRVDSVLTDYEIKRLSDFALRISEFYDKPIEVKWSIEGEEFFILGVRILDKENSVKKKIDLGVEIKKEVKEAEEKEKVKLVEKVQLVEESRERIKDVQIKPLLKVTKTKLSFILDSPEDSSKFLNLGVKKIGLVDLGEILSKIGKHPSGFFENLEEYGRLVYDSLSGAISEFEEVWISLSDISSDKVLEGSPNVEANPLLGLRGLKYGFVYPGILKAELNAIKNLDFNGKLGILLPQIISHGDLVNFKKILSEINFDQVKIGIIAETPAAVQLVKEFCEEKIASVVIKSETLAQYILGIDKNNKELKKVFSESHPAIVSQLEYLLRVCKRNDVKVSLISNNKGLIRALVEKGLDEILVKPSDLNRIAEDVFEIEKECFGGTDKELRQYEVKKEEEKLALKSVCLEGTRPPMEEAGGKEAVTNENISLADQPEEEELVEDEVIENNLEGSSEEVEDKEIIEEHENVKEGEGKIMGEENEEDKEIEIPPLNSEQIEEDIKAIEKEKEEYLEEHPEEKGDEEAGDNETDESKEDIEDVEDYSEGIEGEESNVADEEELNEEKVSEKDTLGIF